MMREELTASWVKRRTRLWEWNECSNCGYKSMSTIWHEDIAPSECPSCGAKMENFVEQREVFPGRIERKIVWDISQLPPIGKCLRYGTIAPKGNYCLTCGWNETEYRRRLQCPWVQKDGLWHLDISLPKEKTT